MARKVLYVVMLNGKIWSNNLPKQAAERQAIECRQTGKGMAYVEKQ